MSNKKRMNVVKIFCVIYVIGSFLLNILPLFFHETNEKDAVADGYTIEKYNVVLDVKEDNKVDVTEYITVNWYNAYHHGILKFTPEWLEYTSSDGKTIKRKSIVSNLRAIGENYTNDYIKKKARIKIGNSYSYVPLGLKEYIISYTYDMGSDPYKGFDEFIFHAIGDYWGTKINNPSIEVHMPKSIKGKTINFYSDKYRESNINQYIDMNIEDNVLYAKLKPNYNLYKSLTLDIELEDNYFIKGSFNYGYNSLICILVIILLTIITIVTWFKYGKNYPKRAKTIEFYPPDDLSPAEIGYIYKGQTSKKLTISLIVELASKGYIKIDELNDAHKNIRVTKLYIEPEKLLSLEATLPRREIIIKKLKDIDGNLSKTASKMMMYYFRNSNVKSIEGSISNFEKIKEELVNGGYIEIVDDNEKTRVEDYDKLKKEYEVKADAYNKELDEYNNKISKLKPLSKLEKIVFDRLFDSDNSVIISEHKTLYLAFTDVDSVLKRETKDLIIDKESTKKLIISVFTSIIVFILALISYMYLEDLDPKLNILYKLSFICIFINIFFTVFMGRKTIYGENIKAKILGFKDFLSKVEKDKLEELVSSDPSYFYDILPYTYVLGVSKKWIKKFENIKMPERDMGSFSFDSDLAYHRMASDVYYPAPVSSSSSSGCSSCGGGCSSCGGGCSSCGGGGSW